MRVLIGALLVAAAWAVPAKLGDPGHAASGQADLSQLSDAELVAALTGEAADIPAGAVHEQPQPQQQQQQQPQQQQQQQQQHQKQR